MGVKMRRMKAALSKKEKEIAGKVQRVIDAQNAGRKYYARADELLAALPKNVLEGEIVRLNEKGRTARVIDQVKALEEEGILWKPCGFRRWDLKVKDS